MFITCLCGSSSIPDTLCIDKLRTSKKGRKKVGKGQMWMKYFESNMVWIVSLLLSVNSIFDLFQRSLIVARIPQSYTIHFTDGMPK